MIFIDGGHGGLGAIVLMKFEGETGRDGVEVAMGPGFVATFENIAFDVIRSGNGDEEVQESVRIGAMVLSIASIVRKKARLVIENLCWILLFN